MTAIDGQDVILDRTYFYAESGGQPADRGQLGGRQVADVQEREDGIVHRLAEAPAFGVGDAVTGVVDDEFRTYCMRAHTASHLLYGAGRHLFDGLGYGGFDIGEEKVRVDLATSSGVDDDDLVELERLVNRAVWDSRPVDWEEVPVEAARKRDRVAFNTKTEEGVMADADTVRVVTIEGWDWAACGGTHVSNTREVGPVEVLDRSNPGEGLTRVEFAVGPPGITRRAAVHREALNAARELGVGVEDLAEAAADLRADRDRLEAEVADLRGGLLDREIAAFPAVERDGATWWVGRVEAGDANAAGEVAKGTVGDDPNAPDVVAAVGDGPAPFVVVASTGVVDAGDVVANVTGEFGGGGGGSPEFAQGGGLDADPADVVAFLREE